VVWDHITGLLAGPALIRAEISKRLGQARTSDPALRQRQRLETALAKAAKSIAAMIEAYSGQLPTIDEMRSRMPQLRAREAGLRAQLDAAQAADRDAHLKLAGDLEGFLAQLRGTTATASTVGRRRVLKLLVKDVLIGPEKITIRHRIPARASATGVTQRDPQPDTEGDHRAGCQVRWGRVDAPLRRAGEGVLGFAELGEEPGFQERLHQRQYPLVLDPSADPAHQCGMGRSRRTNPRLTTGLDDLATLPGMVTITRPRHPLAGKPLRMLGSLRRHGRLELLLVLPDGSKSLVPAAWTGRGEGDGVAGGDVPAAAATLGRLGDLLAACVLVSALSARCQGGAEQAARQSPAKEDSRAACAAQSAAGPGSGATCDVAGPASRRARGRSGHDASRADRPGSSPGRDGTGRGERR
jgi:hypothetical protein